MRAWKRLVKNLDLVGRLVKRDQILAKRAYERGRALGYERGYLDGLNTGADDMLVGIRRVLAPPISAPPLPMAGPRVASPCPMCGEPVELDDDERRRLASFRERGATRQELWLAHCAAVHGHPYTIVRTSPC